MVKLLKSFIYQIFFHVLEIKTEAKTNFESKKNNQIIKRKKSF